MTAPTKASLQRELAKLRREYRGLFIVAVKHKEDNAELRKAIAPVVAYMDKQWPGDVGPELRRLKELCK
jgi:hypothetical protein